MLIICYKQDEQWRGEALRERLRQQEDHLKVVQSWSFHKVTNFETLTFVSPRYPGSAAQTHVLPAGISESAQTADWRQHSGSAQTCRQTGPAPRQLLQRLLLFQWPGSSAKTCQCNWSEAMLHWPFCIDMSKYLHKPSSIYKEVSHFHNICQIMKAGGYRGTDIIKGAARLNPLLPETSTQKPLS